MSGDSVLLYGIKESWNGTDVRIALFHLLKSWVVTTQISFHFHPYKLEMIQFDEHIFQVGWFNH